MRFAWYGRKSVYSDKSDSIDNQERMCREHSDFRFPGEVESWARYSDEDFSGANANRPDLKRLLHDVELGLVDVLVVYQLDRLSRNVRDFSNIYSLLDAKGVKFVSVKENIDTSTPIGRAMMYVTVVFAQMERETISARVVDNMNGLAKKGYWVGGMAPLGYVRMPIEVDGKKHVSLAIEPKGAEYLLWLYDRFIDSGKSIGALATAFRNEGILTPKGCYFSSSQIYTVLTSPFAVEATPEIYDFFAAKGCNMDPGSPREKWDGTHGVMIYGRKTGGKHVSRRAPYEHWLVALGYHKPFVPAAKWLAVQDRLSANTFAKTMKYGTPLLRGVVRCKCGALMMTARKVYKGQVQSAYYCRRRSRQGVEACDCKQINTDVLDEKALEAFRRIDLDHGLIREFLEVEPSTGPDPKELASKISRCEAKIGKLTAALADADGSSAAKYIVAEIERMDLELQALKRERDIAVSEERARGLAKKTAEAKAAEISRLIRGLDGFSDVERNEIVRSVVKSCVWDGKRLFISL